MHCTSPLRCRRYHPHPLTHPPTHLCHVPQPGAFACAGVLKAHATRLNLLPRVTTHHNTGTAGRQDMCARGGRGAQPLRCRRQDDSPVPHSANGAISLQGSGTHVLTCTTPTCSQPVPSMCHPGMLQRDIRGDQRLPSSQHTSVAHAGC